MLLAFDSTDSLQGGCTSHVATEIWRRLPELATLGGPRLVRLNPNVPDKTRGNGALCLELGHGAGKKALAGVVRGVELWAHERLDEPSPAETQRIFETARQTIDELRSPEADSGLIAADRPPAESYYHQAVSTLVDAAPMPSGPHWGWAGGRGIIGALAAAAWRPRRGSFEIIAYRTPQRRGTKRDLSWELGAQLDEAAPRSFDNWDPQHQKLRVAPGSPCPILAGVRGTDASELPRVLPIVEREPIDSWMVFVTNQASGDHLRAARLSSLNPYQGVRVTVRVQGDPASRPGGHVTLRIGDGTAAADACAYEPTKEFRRAVRLLGDGDEIEVEGSTHASASIIALEAFRVTSRAPTTRVQERCSCDATLRSRGRRAPLRCAECGLPPRATQRTRDASEARIAVPTLSRRHLATPPGLSEVRLKLPSAGVAA